MNAGPMNESINQFHSVSLGRNEEYPGVSIEMAASVERLGELIQDLFHSDNAKSTLLSTP
jgi:hypothetical protein